MNRPYYAFFSLMSLLGVSGVAIESAWTAAYARPQDRPIVESRTEFVHFIQGFGAPVVDHGGDPLFQRFGAAEAPAAQQQPAAENPAVVVPPAPDVVATQETAPADVAPTTAPEFLVDTCGGAVIVGPSIEAASLDAGADPITGERYGCGIGQATHCPVSAADPVAALATPPLAITQELATAEAIVAEAHASAPVVADAPSTSEAPAFDFETPQWVLDYLSERRPMSSEELTAPPTEGLSDVASSYAKAEDVAAQSEQGPAFAACSGYPHALLFGAAPDCDRPMTAPESTTARENAPAQLIAEAPAAPEASSPETTSSETVVSDASSSEASANPWIGPEAEMHRHQAEAARSEPSAPAGDIDSWVSEAWKTIDQGVDYATRVAEQAAISVEKAAPTTCEDWLAEEQAEQQQAAADLGREPSAQWRAEQEHDSPATVGRMDLIDESGVAADTLPANPLDAAPLAPIVDAPNLDQIRETAATGLRTAAEWLEWAADFAAGNDSQASVGNGVESR